MMGSQSLVHRGQLNQYVAALTACLGVVCAASCHGWMTPIFNRLMGPKSEIPMTLEEAPWIVSIIDLSTLVSTYPAGFLVNYIGRKSVILATGPINMMSWLFIIYNPSVYVFGVARLMQGFSIGLISTAAPVYLGEIASKSRRGAITSIFFNSWWLGYIAVFSFGALLSFYNYSYITLALNIPFIAFFYWQPESPYYFMMIGDEEKARESLRWFRDLTTEELDEELFEIKENVDESTKTASVKDVVATSVGRKTLLLLLVLSLTTELSGVGAIGVYAAQIFKFMPDRKVHTKTLTVTLGVVMFLGGCISSFTLDTLGRRPLLLISCIGSLICQLITGTYYFLLDNTSVEASRFSWVAISSIIVYSGICTAGMYPVCSAYTSELFDSQTRGIASSVSAMAITLSGVASVLLYEPITFNCGLYANFYLYSACIFSGTLYFYFTAPETKGKSFAQIRKDFSEDGDVENTSRSDITRL